MLTTSFSHLKHPNTLCFIKNNVLFTADPLSLNFFNLKVSPLKPVKLSILPSNLQSSSFDPYNLVFYTYLFYDQQTLKKHQKHLTHVFVYFWAKITFRGKGFRVRKFYKAKKLTLNFGKSHWTKIKFSPLFSHIFKIRRQNYIFITPFFDNFFQFMYRFRYIKKINWYTKRGLRLKKQKIKKRFGKISQMVSSLHF